MEEPEGFTEVFTETYVSGNIFLRRRKRWPLFAFLSRRLCVYFVKPSV